MPADKFHNWSKLAETLGDAAKALYELYELRNEALILAHQLKQENAKLHDQLVKVISTPDVQNDRRR